jgi:hypothetical protein
MRQPFAELPPRAVGEPSRPTHVNYDYLNTTEDAAGALSRLSEVYEKRITEQRRGEVSWEETSAEAAKILSDTLGGVPTRASSCRASRARPPVPPRSSPASSS